MPEDRAALLQLPIAMRRRSSRPPRTWTAAPGDATGRDCRESRRIRRRARPATLERLHIAWPSAGNTGAIRPGRPRRPAGRSSTRPSSGRALRASRPASGRGRSRRRGRGPTRSRGGRRRSRPSARPAWTAAPSGASRQPSIGERRRLGPHRDPRVPSRAARGAAAGPRRATRTATGSAPPGSIQAAANGEGPSSDRNRTAGLVASQARADGCRAGLRGPRGGSRGAGGGRGRPP